MVRCIVPSMQDGNGLMGWMDVMCVICVAMNLLVSLGTGSSSIVGQKAPTQPAASPGWDANALGSSGKSEHGRRGR